MMEAYQFPGLTDGKCLQSYYPFSVPFSIPSPNLWDRLEGIRPQGKMNDKRERNGSLLSHLYLPPPSLFNLGKIWERLGEMDVWGVPSLVPAGQALTYILISPFLSFLFLSSLYHLFLHSFISWRSMIERDRKGKEWHVRSLPTPFSVVSSLVIDWKNPDMR